MEGAPNREPSAGDLAFSLLAIKEYGNMQRYFIETTIEEARISGEDARHIERVMRMKEGDKIVVVAQNTAHICEIVAFEADEVHVQTTGEIIPSPELPVHVTVACGLPKGDKLELITQKATELGMFALMPFEAERSSLNGIKRKVRKSKSGYKKLQKKQLSNPIVHISQKFMNQSLLNSY